MLQWLTRTVKQYQPQPAFTPDKSVLEDASFGEVYAVVDIFRQLRDADSRTDEDIEAALEMTAGRLDFLAIIAAGSKPLRRERYTQGVVASAATLWKICLDIDSRQLADLIHVCERIIKRARWYSHQLNRP